MYLLYYYTYIYSIYVWACMYYCTPLYYVLSLLYYLYILYIYIFVHRWIDENKLSRSYATAFAGVGKSGTGCCSVM